MTKKETIDVLVGIVAPIVGRYLAERVAERLYEVLSGLDKEATDRLLDLASTTPLGRP